MIRRFYEIEEHLAKDDIIAQENLSTRSVSINTSPDWEGRDC